MEAKHKLNPKSIIFLLFFMVFSLFGHSVVKGQCSANANFTSTFTNCSETQFIDLSNAAPNYTIISWNWDFGDGNTSTLQNPVHTYAPGFIGIVTLTVVADSAGWTCPDTRVRPIVVPDLPTVYFTWDPEPTCLGSATRFFGTSGNPIVLWEWDFGDGFSSNIQNPIHNYLLPGSYQVILRVTDNNGCINADTNTVNVGAIPDVDFTFNPDPTCLNDITYFFGSSSIAPYATSWTWDFGDGGVAFTQDAIHTYLSPGTYDATLTIEDTNGCTNSVTYPVIVNPLPTANFFHDGPRCLNDSVNFTNISTSPNGFIAQWEWDFGDGNTQTVVFPNDPNVAHLYSNPGTFQVMLTVTDSDGCTNTTFRDVIIVANPIADFNYTPACNQQPVQFNDLSSPNGGNDIFSWYWEFGDPASGVNNTSTLRNPSHTFSNQGTFDVLLIVTNTDGCTDSVTHPVTVNGLPDVQITTDSDTVCVGALANFYGSGSANIVTWLWNFGDGTTSVLQNPQHVFPSAGTYNVSLTATDDNGCDSTATRLITVNPLPFADFNTSAPSCANSYVDFFDMSSAPNGWVTQWHWYFGDGTDTIVLFPDPPDVSHIYTAPGQYIASLVITSNAGCVDSVTHAVNVSVSPQADFIADGPQCEGNLIQFLDQSQGLGVDIQAWSWNFGDPASGTNNTSNLQNPYHLFSSSGTYNVFLEVMNSNGCYDTISKNINIYPPPPVYFLVSPAGGVCQNDTAFFFVDPDTTNVPTIMSFFWDFGDPASGSSDTSSLPNPWHVFTGFGTYNVSLTITDTAGCSNTVTLPVEVWEIPTADYTFSAGCFGDSTYFTDQSEPGASIISQWRWKFNDPAFAPGDTSNEQFTAWMFSDIDDYFVQLRVTDNNGCHDTYGQWVEIFDVPQADFTFSQQCDPPGTVQFFDESLIGTSGSPLISWEWELDDGYFSTEINPVYTYNEVDTCYIVSLTVTDEHGCINTYSDTVCLFGEVSVDFTAEQVCFDQRTNFQGSFLPASDSIAAWRWDFGDGTPIVATPHDTISHLYPAPGTYLVALFAEDENGCEAEAYHTVVVDSLPTPDFIADTAFCNDITRFFDRSVGNNGTFIQSWYWDFGDPASGAANNSTEQNPTHFYSGNDSIYFVTLIVTNYNDCVDSIVKPVYKGPCLTADFEVIDPPFCSRYPVCFVNNSQFNGSSGAIGQWTFNYGDGNSDVFVSRPDTICHVYDTAGIYNVYFVIEANVMGTVYRDTAFMDLKINPTPSAEFTTYMTCSNEMTLFENLTDNNGANVASYRWDFGDITSENDTSTLENPSYRYPYAGTFDVEFVVNSDVGCYDTVMRPIEIFEPPTADFSSSSGCVNTYTQFWDETDTTGADIYRWDWSFGDDQAINDTSVIQNPTYTYTSTGTYLVTLMVEDLNQCRDTVEQTIEVYEVPFSDFDIVEGYQGVQGQVLFENLTEGGEYYDWDFGNGETSIEFSPVVTYTEDGTYIITLVAYNDYGCPDTTVMEYDLLFKSLYIPSAFVPQGPEELRLWRPVGENIKDYRVEIYNLWGNLLWSSERLDNGRPAEGWRGWKDNNRDEELVGPGNYIWKASATFIDGSIWRGMPDEDGNLRTSGTITVIR
ncbi:MAG: PKD domain-containing protein [Bacteroidales bacterium]|nr:PKD domain-containing protein [Bacteroidales bacterium]